METKKDHYLNMLKVRKYNTLVKVIPGIRRAGKSDLLSFIR